MTYLTRYEPFRAFRREFDRLFEDFLPALQEEEEPAAMWMPRLDLTETDDAFVARMDLPGLKHEDIQVDVENNRLTIRGERKVEKREEKEDVVRMERNYGTFFRALTLPDNVLADQIAATFEDGVLTLQIPKAEESKPRRIEVQPARALALN
jgi:HSP20 family protein